MSLDKQTIAQLDSMGLHEVPEYLVAKERAEYLHKLFMGQQEYKTQLWKLMSKETRAVVFQLNTFLSGLNWWAKLMTGQRK